MSVPAPRDPDRPSAVNLAACVDEADAALAPTTSDGAILRVATLGADGPDDLAWFPLDGGHPLDVLLGFVAPDHWMALGVSTPGHAHPVGDDGRVVRSADPSRIRVTVLFDRSGRAAGRLRQGGEVAALPGSPEGVVTDACRRCLGLATGPPPATTALLWTLTWLDRLVDAAGGATTSRRPASWADVARLHPAASSPPPGPEADVGPEPGALAAATVALAEAWPWSRLRADPSLVDVPGALPEPHVIRWMDDGMWARWLLSTFPTIDDLVAAVWGLLPDRVASAVVEVVDGSPGGAS
jgi:hypothetical protein